MGFDMKHTSSVFRSLPAALTLSLVLAACSGNDPAKLMQSAKDYMAKSDHVAAIIQLKNALQSQPELAEARFLLGKALLANGDAAGAQIELKKAQEGGYAQDQVLPLLVQVMLAQGQAKAVTDTYDQTQLASPDAQAELQTQLAIAWFAQGKADLAQAKLAEALKAQANHVPALLLKARVAASERDFDGALAQVAQILKVAPQNGDAYKLRGDIQLMGLRQADEALASYREAVKLKPNYKDAQASIVRVLLAQNKLPEATTEVEALNKMAAKAPFTLYLQAQLALQKQDLKAAREAAQLLLRATPDNPQALELAGTIEVRANALVQAEAMLAKALSTAPDLMLARRMLTLTYLRSGQVDKAVATLPANIDEIDNDANLLALAGQAFMIQGDQERAQRYFAKAAALDPKDPVKRTSLAMSKVVGGQVDAGFSDLQDIAASDSGIVADMAMINVLARQGKLDEALKAIDQLAKKRVNDPIPSHLRAQVLLKRGDDAGARKAWEKSLEITPDFFPAISALSEMDLRSNQTDAAQKHYEDLLKRKPDSVQALLGLARVKSIRKASKEEVASLLRKAVDAGPSEVLPRQLLVAHHLRHQEPKLALTAAQNAIAALPKSAELLDTLGQAQMAAKEFNQAVSTYGKMAALQPRSTFPHLRMAGAYMTNNDPTGAAQSLRKALEIQPNLVAAQQGLIELAVRDKRVPEALGIAKDIQKQRPQEPVGFALEAEVHMAARNWAAATVAYEQALRLAPDSTDLAVKLHTAHLTAQKTREADVFAASWLRGHPKDLAFNQYLGDRAVAANDLKTAEGYYQKVLSAQPKNAVALNNMAWVASKLGRKDAMSFIDQANQVAPDTPAILDTWAMMLAAEKNFSKALEIQKRAVQLQPDAALFKFNLAQIQIQAGDKAGAKANLQALKQMGNSFNRQAEVDKMLRTL